MLLIAIRRSGQRIPRARYKPTNFDRIILIESNAEMYNVKKNSRTMDETDIATANIAEFGDPVDVSEIVGK